jgi:uncharacterized membrane protein YfcA
VAALDRRAPANQPAETIQPPPPMTPTVVLKALAVGSLAGVIAALCGVGGGVVMVPAFVMLLGLSQKHAVATSLMAMIPTAIVTSLKNQAVFGAAVGGGAGGRLGDWKLALLAGLGGSLMGWFAADWMRQWSDEKLVRFFGVILVLMGMRMLVWGKA